MRRLVLAVALLFSAYAFVWGITWLAGDMSRVVSVVTSAGTFNSYPGVFLGGLPPTPTGNLNTPLFGAVLGVAGLLLSGALLRRTRSS